MLIDILKAFQFISDILYQIWMLQKNETDVELISFIK